MRTARRILTITAALILVVSVAFAQHTLRAQPVPGPLKQAGVYHVATGTWSHGRDALQPPVKYYNNSANTGFYGVIGQAIDLIWTDEGCIPGPAHKAGATPGTLLVQELEFAYCTGVFGGLQTGGLLFYDSYTSCTDPLALPVICNFPFSVPSADGGVYPCWLITFDLAGSAVEFTLTDDADGVFDGTTSLDNFGWTLIMHDGGSGGFNGPFLNGDPNNFPYGDGTYYQNPGASVATGLGTRDQFWLSDPTSAIPDGCYSFFGYDQGNPFGSFWLSINGKPAADGGFVKYCSANPNSTGAPADISASGSASSAAGDLALTSAPVPNQWSTFFHAMNRSQIPFGNGFLCATGDVVRGAVVVATGSAATYTYDNSDAKHSLAAQVGLTRNFQHWFRDPMGGGAGFNTSNGISILILP